MFEEILKNSKYELSDILEQIPVEIFIKISNKLS